MEEAHLQKHNSLSKISQITTSPNPQNSVDLSNDDACDQHSAHHTHEIAHNVDQFITTIAAIDDKSSDSPEIPDFIETFSKIIESRVKKYKKSSDTGTRFGKMTEDDLLFIHSVRRISKLTNALSEFPADSNVNPSMNQTSAALQHAMVFLEEEFRALLEDSRSDADAEIVLRLSSCSLKSQQDYCELEDPGQSEEYPAYSPEVVAKMHEIASTMISAGYETECCQVYYISRRNAIRKKMARMDFEIMWNMDDVAKAAWETLEAEISRWINVVKACSEIIFPGEKRLGEAVFADYPSICRSSLSNIIRGVVIQLLDFAEATAMAKRSAEKLFKYLDMYEALQCLVPTITGDSCWGDLIDEVSDAVDRIGESAVSNFCDLENSIKGDLARTPVPGGAVHPLTRYVMNYLKYTCDYKDTLEKIFEKHTQLVRRFPVAVSLDLEKESESPHNFETMAGTTAFSIQVVTVMDLLDGNLDKKSKLYRDTALRYIFLMNNGRYILQKVKGASEILQVMGDTWCRRRSTVVRQYHKNYQRETWNRVLQTLNQEGLVVNGKPNKPLIKERFKIFTTTFEEIYRSQTTWVVSDEQLQSELRISISAVLIPAYRAFVGRFRQYMDNHRQADKYIKYQPEDVETMIEKLFEGNSISMLRRK
ncbi:exocyst complex component EXO70B1 [Salvia miltiorrhiza]|uniref:exocyst complex component EXO70B1 n=1 Tax=Salvia miltiorrhiza TaxID=226208 RepID=UPI0025AC94A4|nr:exocyst complex component EXO70B1 [Salvia miltiorrhiza]